MTEPRNLRELLSTLHGIILPGSGPDIDPRYYGEQKTARFTCMSKQRTEFEIGLIKTAARQELPLLGLCGGMQMINVAFGGNLIQDIPTQIVSPLQHRQPISCEEPHHPITVMEGTLLSKITRVRRTRVNSSHHQAIKQIADGFRMNATSSDRVIEGIEHPDHPFLLGVQWHPEFLYPHDPVSKRIFRAFLREARKRYR
jgi:putative glutamine amidotransferase